MPMVPIAQGVRQSKATKAATDGAKGRHIWLSLNQMAGPSVWNYEEEASLMDSASLASWGTMWIPPMICMAG